MSIQMQGTEVAKAMKEQLIREREELNAAGVNPCLTIIRVGAKESDLAYERGAKKRMEMIGIECRIVELPEEISQEEFETAFRAVNEDPEVHGILLFQPLPAQLDVEKIRQMISPAKDMDGMSPANLAKSIVIEAAELLECFQWSDTEYDLQHIKEELADVLVYSQNLLDKLELDADEIVNMKMKQNEAKYPVDKAKGNATKYTEL